MKPLLLDILACPICKFYPLKLYILKWETSDDKFTKIQEAFHKKDLESMKNATQIRRGKDRVDDGVTIVKDTAVLIKDEIVRTQADIIKYFNEAEAKLENFSVIEDYSEENYSKLLNLIKTKVVKRILDSKAKIDGKELESIPLETQKEIIDDLTAEIYLLNWFFQFSEIEEGVIFCEKCARWYPIIETIPQMLPDDLREKQPEIKFLESWQSKLPKSITEEGKPFNIK